MPTEIPDSLWKAATPIERQIAAGEFWLKLTGKTEDGVVPSVYDDPQTQYPEKSADFDKVARAGLGHLPHIATEADHLLNAGRKTLHAVQAAHGAESAGRATAHAADHAAPAAAHTTHHYRPHINMPNPPFRPKRTPLPFRKAPAETPKSNHLRNAGLALGGTALLGATALGGMGAGAVGTAGAIGAAAGAHHLYKKHQQRHTLTKKASSLLAGVRAGESVVAKAAPTFANKMWGAARSLVPGAEHAAPAAAPAFVNRAVGAVKSVVPGMAEHAAPTSLLAGMHAPAAAGAAPASPAVAKRLKFLPGRPVPKAGVPDPGRIAKARAAEAAKGAAPAPILDRAKFVPNTPKPDIMAPRPANVVPEPSNIPWGHIAAGTAAVGALGAAGAGGMATGAAGAYGVHRMLQNHYAPQQPKLADYFEKGAGIGTAAAGAANLRTLGVGTVLGGAGAYGGAKLIKALDTEKVALNPWVARAGLGAVGGAATATAASGIAPLIMYSKARTRYGGKTRNEISREGNIAQLHNENAENTMLGPIKLKYQHAMLNLAHKEKEHPFLASAAKATPLIAGAGVGGAMAGLLGGGNVARVVNNVTPRLSRFI